MSLREHAIQVLIVPGLYRTGQNGQGNDVDQPSSTQETHVTIQSIGNSIPKNCRCAQDGTGSGERMGQNSKK